MRRPPEELAFLRYLDEGDPEAMEQVFRLTAPKLLLVAAHLTRDAARAEDLVQATFLAALRDRGRFDRSCSLLPWLTGILVHRARDVQRREGRRRGDGPAEGLAAGLADEAARTPLDELVGEEIVGAVSSAIDELPDLYRDVLVLRLTHGLRPTEIAHALGRSPGTVRTHLQRGLDRLRSRLPEELALPALLVLEPERGLDAVRAAVVREAGRASGTAASTASAASSASAAGATNLGATIAMKATWIGAAAAATLVASLWMLSRSPAPASVDTTPAAPTDVVVAAGAPEIAAPRTAAPGPAGERVPAGGEVEALGSLRVRVRTADGEPAADVGVHLVAADAPGRGREARTGEDGELLFDALQAGAYRLLLDRAGERTVAIEAGPPRTLTITLPRGIDVEGRVVDLLGDPVPGAEIQRVQPGHPDFAHRVATAGDDGRFTLRDLEPESELLARATRYQPSAPEGVDGDPGDTVQVELVTGALGQRLAGVVVDGDGAPAAGVLVGIAVDEDAREQHEGLTDVDLEEHDAQSTKPLDREAFFVRTGADGRFETGEVPAGDALLFARGPEKDDPRVAVLRVRIARDGIHEVRLQLERGAEVYGTVRDETGRPFDGVVVRNTWDGTDELGSLEDDMGPLLGDRATLTDATGAYRLRGLLPGEHDLYVGEERAELCRGDVELAPGESAPWNPVLDQRGELRVRVLGPGDAPLVGWGVSARRDASHLGRSAYPRTDGEGRAVLEHVPVAEQRISVHAPLDAGEDLDGFPALVHDGALPGPDELVLRVDPLPSASIAGRLVRADGGALEGGKLRLVHADSRTDRLAPLREGTGAFDFDALPAGTYELDASAHGYPPGVRIGRWTLGPGQRLDAGELRLADPAVLSVDLRTGDGGAVEGAVVRVRTKPEDDAEHGYARALQRDEAGLWRSGPLPPGTYELSVSAVDVVPHLEVVELAGGPQLQHVVLSRGVECVLDVSFADYREGVSEPRALDAARIDVSVRDHRGEVVRSERWTKRWEGEQRRARFPMRLAPGTYDVAVTDQTMRRREDRARVELRVEVAAGDTVVVDVDLRQ